MPVSHVTLCHPLLGVINEYLEKAGLWTPFSLIFKGFQGMSPQKRSEYISGTISASLGNFVLGVGLVFTKKIYKFTYSYQAQLKIWSLTSRTNKQYWNSGAPSGRRPKGGPSTFSQGTPWVLVWPPMRLESPWYPKAFPQTFIHIYVLDQFSCTTASATARRGVAGTTAQARRPMVAPRLYHTEWYVFDK